LIVVEPIIILGTGAPSIRVVDKILPEEILGILRIYPAFNPTCSSTFKESSLVPFLSPPPMIVDVAESKKNTVIKALDFSKHWKLSQSGMVATTDGIGIGIGRNRDSDRDRGSDRDSDRGDRDRTRV
jgi:hypothetical protein